MSFPISLPAVIAAPSALLAKLVPPGECPEHWYCHHPEVLSQASQRQKPAALPCCWRPHPEETLLLCLLLVWKTL